MEKNNNIYINQVLYENFQLISINQEEYIEIKELSSEGDKIEKISYDEALKSYFNAGLNINGYLVDSERYNNTPITMIEDLTIGSSNSRALLETYNNIDENFFKELPYKEKKSIVNHLTTKAFFSDGDIDYLLNTLYGKGFLIEQETKNSLEVSWIENQKIDCIKTIFQQQHFDFDFKYIYEGKEMDFTSIVTFNIVKSKNEKELGYEAKIYTLEQILESANQLILYQTLKAHSFEEDSEENGEFKI